MVGGHNGASKQQCMFAPCKKKILCQVESLGKSAAMEIIRALVFLLLSLSGTHSESMRSKSYSTAH